MAFRLFNSVSRKRLLSGGTALGSASIIVDSTIRREPLRLDNGVASAEEQFYTASIYPVPKGYSGKTFRLKVNYQQAATPSTVQEKSYGSSWPTLPAPGQLSPLPDVYPWLEKDFKNPEQAYEYCELVKAYCWAGNVNNGFQIWENNVRDWFHAPWMHYGAKGREPISGLTYERPIPQHEFSKTQNDYLQNWAVGFYNAAGASVFGQVWGNPSAPQWTNNVKFPVGTCVFKIIMTDATDEAVPSLRGAPSLPAVIAPNSGDPNKPPSTATVRNDFVSDVRLIQVDFAVRDDRAPIGWVFGTFMYDSESKAKNGWDRIIPVGLMWGNDPNLNQASYDAGNSPKESWINPRAEQIRKDLGGKRPSWGWNGRMNGPADNFISSCASCHSTSQLPATTGMIQPKPHYVGGKWIPVDDSATMRWFRNVKAGEAFNAGSVSCDYSLQLMIGMNNYQAWLKSTNPLPSALLSRGTKYTHSQ